MNKQRIVTETTTYNWHMTRQEWVPDTKQVKTEEHEIVPGERPQPPRRTFNFKALPDAADPSRLLQ